MDTTSLFFLFWFVVFSILFLVNRHLKGKLSKMLKLVRTFRPLLMEKADSGSLSRVTREHFDSETPALLNDGYRLLGDYKLTCEPMASFARLFLEPKGNYFVELLSMSNTPAFSLIGYLEDGTVISTGAYARGRPLKTQDLLHSKNYFVEFGQDMNSTRLLQNHEARMQAISQVAESPIQIIPELDWVAFFKYHNRRYGQIHFEAGEMDNQPEGDVVFPSIGSSTAP